MGRNRNRRGFVEVTEPIIVFVKTWNGIRAPGRHNKDKCGDTFFSEVEISFCQVESGSLASPCLGLLNFESVLGVLFKLSRLCTMWYSNKEEWGILM